LIGVFLFGRMEILRITKQDVIFNHVVEFDNSIFFAIMNVEKWIQGNKI